MLAAFDNVDAADTTDPALEAAGRRRWFEAD
jgi:hypothetical protein